MTDNWDFYSLLVDSKPASIFVDLGIEGSAPVGHLPHMVYVRLYMQAPRPDGLSSQQEFNKLVEIEDGLAEALCSEYVGYVGRNTSDGCRDFYFYVGHPDAWRAAVDSVLARFDGYQYDVGAREDPGWSSYFKFLLPGAIDRQRIENRRVCDVLDRHGDKLEIAREIDHWCYFASASELDAFLEDAIAMGFSLRDRIANDQSARPLGAQIWRTDCPSYGQIDEIVLPLYEAATRHGGEYDGWECPLLADAARDAQP